MLRDSPVDHSTEVLRDRLRSARILAYQGDGASGAHVVSTLRQEVEVHANPHFASEVMTTEGILDATAGRWLEAIDRFRRSIAVSKLGSSSEIESFSIVWLAHCLFNVGRIIESANLIAALRVTSPSIDLEFIHRFATVISQLYGYCCERSVSEAWSNCAKRAASELGLNSLFSAGIYNMCAMRVWQDVLLPRLRGECVGNHIASDLLFLDSTDNYDSITSTSQREFLRVLLRAQLTGAAGNYRDSNASIAGLLGDQESLPAVEYSRVVLENIWNLLKSGELAVAMTLEEAMRRVSVARTVFADSDDLAFVELLSRDLASLGGSTHRAQLFDVERLRYLSIIQKTQSDLLECLNSINLPRPEELVVPVGRVKIANSL